VSIGAFDQEYIDTVLRFMNKYSGPITLFVDTNGDDPTAESFKYWVSLGRTLPGGSGWSSPCISRTNDFSTEEGERDLTGVELRSVILAIAATGRPLWAKDSAAVAASIFRLTKVRLRNLRDLDTAIAIIAPTDTGDLGPVDLVEKIAKRPHLKALAVEEQRQQEIWNWRSHQGHRIDRYALADAKLHLDESRAESLERTDGIDLWNSSRPQPIFDWLDERGIQITDHASNRRLGHDYWDTAIVQPGSEDEFKFFQQTRSDAASVGALNDIRNHLDKAGRVHTVFSTMGTRTGRFTSTKPAIQNLPKRLRHLVIPENGMAFVSNDLNFCEVGVAAMLSHDPALIEACKADPYVAFAVSLWGEGAREDPGLRKKAKLALISSMYGRQAPSLARLLKVDVDEARSIQRSIRTSYPQLALWTDRIEQDVREGIPLKTLRGRVLAMPEKPFQGPNTVIQSVAAELWKTMALDVLAKLPLDAALMPMHDELVVEVNNSFASIANARALLAKRMSATVGGVTIHGTPEVLGDSWGKGT
jgi:hypothetical protein